MIEIHGIPREQASHYWPLVDGWCEDALEYGGDVMDTQDIHIAVDERRMQLWVIYVDETLKAVCVTQINVWPRAKVLTAIIVAGDDMHEWVNDLDNLLTRYAHEYGCKFVDAWGRKGWSKVLKGLQWIERQSIYVKEVCQ